TEGAGVQVVQWNDNTGVELDGVTQLLKPNMIVDFDWVNVANLNDQGAPPGRRSPLRPARMNRLRTLISTNAPAEDHWAIGPRGWVIVGFGNGFIPKVENEIRFTEIYTGEWVDIWVAKELPNIENSGLFGAVYRGAKEPVRIKTNAPIRSVVQTCIANGTTRYIAQPRDTFTELHPYRKIRVDGTFKYVDENGVQSDLNDLPNGALICDGGIPQGWKYIGSLKGSGGFFGDAARPVRTVPGPHLGFLKDIDPQRHHYILFTDSTWIPGTQGPTTPQGPGLVQVGVAQTDVINLTNHFHLLVIDDSASVTGKKSDFLNELLSKVQDWARGPSTKKYLGIRLIKWRNGVTNVRKNRTTIDGQVTIDRANYALKFGGANWTTRPNWDELTVRLDLNSFPGDKPFGNQWVEFSEAQMNTFGPRLRTFLNASLGLDSDDTPFVETLDDILFKDMEELRPQILTLDAGRRRVPLEILVVSDGIPDPLQQFNSPSVLCNPTSTSSNNLRTFLVTPGVSPKAYRIDTYDVESKMKYISENIVQSYVKIISNLRCSGVPRSWVQDFYQSPPMNEFVRYEMRPDDNANPLVILDSFIDNRLIPHTDSTHVDNTRSNRTFRGSSKRIGLLNRIAYPVLSTVLRNWGNRYKCTDEFPNLLPGIDYQDRNRFPNCAVGMARDNPRTTVIPGELLDDYPVVIRHFFNSDRNRLEYIALKSDKKFIRAYVNTATNQFVSREEDALVHKTTDSEYSGLSDASITMEMALEIIGRRYDFDCFKAIERTKIV
ncbi:MAG: hypothetical protein ABJO02_00965, partial [Reichenbachiella sp.]